MRKHVSSQLPLKPFTSHDNVKTCAARASPSARPQFVLPPLMIDQGSGVAFRGSHSDMRQTSLAAHSLPQPFRSLTLFQLFRKQFMRVHLASCSMHSCADQTLQPRFVPSFDPTNC